METMRERRGRWGQQQPPRQPDLQLPQMKQVPPEISAEIWELFLQGKAINTIKGAVKDKYAAAYPTQIITNVINKVRTMSADERATYGFRERSLVPAGRTSPQSNSVSIQQQQSVPATSGVSFPQDTVHELIRGIQSISGRSASPPALSVPSYEPAHCNGVIKIISAWRECSYCEEKDSVLEEQVQSLANGNIGRYYRVWPLVKVLHSSSKADRAKFQHERQMFGQLMPIFPFYFPILFIANVDRKVIAQFRCGLVASRIAELAVYIDRMKTLPPFYADVPGDFYHSAVVTHDAGNPRWIHKGGTTTQSIQEHA